MANLKFSFTLSAPSRPKGILCVVVGYKGSSQGRKSYVIDGLSSPDFRLWDNKNQRFFDKTDTGKANNPILDALKVLCNELLDNSLINTPDQFINALKTNKNPIITLGDYIRTLIDQMKNGTNDKKPSRNYQLYTNLLHKLEIEQRVQYDGKNCDLINIPIEKVDNKHFIQFSKFVRWLPKNEGKTNYLKLMRLFKQVHTKACEEELNDHTLRYPYAKNAPTINNTFTTKKPSLTTKQYKEFIKLDVKTLPKSGTLTYKLMEMYQDYCIFLYETKMRPADVTKAKVQNIITDDGKKYYRYVPEKKKNYSAEKNKNIIVRTPLNDTALQIIDKYKGMSEHGYIFPFSMNNYDWDMSDAKDWNKWNNRKTRLQEMINNWLRDKVIKAMNLDIPLTLYTFRHSTFTHACRAKGADLMKIALEGGTSILMLQNHYVDAR